MAQPAKTRKHDIERLSPPDPVQPFEHRLLRPNSLPPARTPCYKRRMNDHAPMPEMLVDAANAGRRLDSFVRKACPDMPLAALMRMIRVGGVRLNGGRAKGATRLATADRVRLPLGSVRASASVMRRSKPLAVPLLYEDDAILVVQKPAGLACHAGTLHRSDSLMHQVEAYLSTQKNVVGHSPGLAQRLDLGVSGVMVVGKHAAALRQLSAAVLAGTIDKRYTALVTGRVKQESGCIDAPLRVDDQPMGNRPRTVVDPLGKPAYTSYQVVQRLRGATLLHVRIQTGRTHQIRAHLRHLGHPIVGDPRYGDALINDRMCETHGLRWPFLHAGLVSFNHPETAEPLSFEAPLSKIQQQVLRAHGGE